MITYASGVGWIWTKILTINVLLGCKKMRYLLIKFLVWIDEVSYDWRWVEWLNRHVIDRDS